MALRNLGEYFGTRVPQSFTSNLLRGLKNMPIKCLFMLLLLEHLHAYHRVSGRYVESGVNAGALQRHEHAEGRNVLKRVSQDTVTTKIPPRYFKVAQRNLKSTVQDSTRSSTASGAELSAMGETSLKKAQSATKSCHSVRILKAKEVLHSKSVELEGLMASDEKHVKTEAIDTQQIESQFKPSTESSTSLPQSSDNSITSSEVEYISNGGSILVLQHSGFRQQKPICRIEGICRVGDGSFLMPQWMEKHKSVLDQCGIHKSHFVLHAEDMPSTNLKEIPNSPRWSVKESNEGPVSLTYNFSDWDLFGGTAPHEKSFMLATDMAPILVLLDIFSEIQQYLTDGAVKLTKCITAADATCSNSSLSPRISPLLVVDASITEKPFFHWSQGFIRLVRDGFLGSLKIADLQDIYGWRFRTQAACLRSLIVTPSSISDIPSDLFDSSNILYRANSLNRKSILDPVHGLKSFELTNQRKEMLSHCSVKVMILNKYGKRHIIGDEALLEAIEVHAKAAKEKYPAVKFLPEVVYFDNSSFHEQVMVMQESSIVIAAFGDSNSNIIFLRPDTSFFVITPFGVSPDTYANLARVVGVDFEVITAQPDDEVFESCVKHHNSKSKETSTILSQWKAAADDFRNDAKISGKNPSSHFFFANYTNITPGNRVRRLRHCAAYQRLSFNIIDAAASVVRRALRICGVEPQ